MSPAAAIAATVATTPAWKRNRRAPRVPIAVSTGMSSRAVFTWRACIQEPSGIVGSTSSPTNGFVDRITRTMALRKVGRAQDVARVVVALASDRAAGERLTRRGVLDARFDWNAIARASAVTFHEALAGRPER